MDQIVSSVRVYSKVLVNGQCTNKINQCLGKNADFVYALKFFLISVYSLLKALPCI
jgi:hypothetical protein